MFAILTVAQRQLGARNNNFQDFHVTYFCVKYIVLFNIQYVYSENTSTGNQKKYQITVITVIRCGYIGKCYHNQTSVVYWYYANSSCLTLKRVYPNNRSLGPPFFNFSYLLLKASRSLIYILFADDILFSIEPCSKLNLQTQNIGVLPVNRL